MYRLSLICAMLLATVAALHAAEESEPLRFSFGIDYMHQFESDFDTVGDFDLDRFRLSIGADYAFDRQSSAGLNLAYTRLEYDFGNLSAAPWEGVDIWQLSAPVRWGLNHDTTLILIPTLTASAEDGADLDDALTGGAIVAVTWRYSDALTVGAGMGAFSELEDSATYFPFFTVYWQATESLTVNLGQSDDVSSGPGLTLTYQQGERCKWLLGATYTQYRFRLDDGGPVPGGVGEDSAMRAWLGYEYAFTPAVALRLKAGLAFAGEVELNDANGTSLGTEDYDTAPYAGASLTVRF